MRFLALEFRILFSAVQPSHNARLCEIEYRYECSIRIAIDTLNNLYAGQVSAKIETHKTGEMTTHLREALSSKSDVIPRATYLFWGYRQIVVHCLGTFVMQQCCPLIICAIGSARNTAKLNSRPMASSVEDQQLDRRVM